MNGPPDIVQSAENTVPWTQSAERHAPARLALIWAGIISAVLLLIVHRHYGVSMAVGESMQPTLRTGSLLLIDKLAYRHSEPKRGDIVVARYRRQLLVKRVVGLPGEEVEVKHGLLYVNQKRLAEGHLVNPGDLAIGGGRLSAGKWALLGDNRDLTSSTAIHGIVAKDQILGKVILAWR